MLHNEIDELLSSKSVDRRCSTRYMFRADIEIEWGQSRKVWGRVHNISRHGMFIELPDIPPINARFLAKLALGIPLEIECTVRRTVPRYGIGVSIAITHEEARRRFDALLVALAQDSDASAAGADIPPPSAPSEPSHAAAAFAGK